MKVNIGPYRNRWVSYVHDKYMDKKYGRFDWDDSYTDFERFLEKVEDALQWLYNHTINLWLDSREPQSINVRIDSWDTFSMDHTLAYIILPMLKQIGECKNGAPFVDDEDVPEELRSTSAPPKENDYDLDDHHFKRWDWVVNEMIWTFEQKVRDDWESDYYEYEHFEPVKDAKSFKERLGVRLLWSDDEGRKAHQERMNNGFRLFGKYYENLWT